MEHSEFLYLIEMGSTEGILGIFFFLPRPAERFICVPNRAQSVLSQAWSWTSQLAS